MKDPIRKLTVSPKKVSKSVLVVTNTARMLPKMAGIRALGYRCDSINAGGGVMHVLQRGERINAIVIDLVAEIGAERLIRWIRENRPGVRVVCILNASSCFGPNAVALGAVVLGESEIDRVPEVIRNILEPTRETAHNETPPDF